MVGKRRVAPCYSGSTRHHPNLGGLLTPSATCFQSFASYSVFVIGTVLLEQSWGACEALWRMIEVQFEEPSPIDLNCLQYRSLLLADIFAITAIIGGAR